MDLYKIFNWFWLEVPYRNGYKPLYAVLFFAIVDGINKNYWRANTPLEYDRIINKCRFTKEVYLNGRKWLMENKFIDFVPGKNNMQIACFSLGEAVGKLTGVLTGELTGVPTEEREENLPASLPVGLPIIKRQINNKPLKHKTDKQINISFETFWNLYDKKVGAKQKIESLWKNMTDDERSVAIDHVVPYKNSQPNKQYRKNPETYLRNKSFNDEIINANGTTNGNHSAKSTNGTQQGFNLAFNKLATYGAMEDL